MATTVTTGSERAAIEHVVQLYIDGASKGEPEKLREAFHGQAWMFGSLGGDRYDVPVEKLIEMTAAQPLDTDGSFTARISSVEQIGDAAVVRLEEDGCWGGVSFVDFFTLVKVDGAWKIANKTFAHTGGSPAAA